jgi:hypothetical protein
MPPSLFFINTLQLFHLIQNADRKANHQRYFPRCTAFHDFHARAFKKS